jgi:hypothetical protein
LYLNERDGMHKVFFNLLLKVQPLYERALSPTTKFHNGLASNLIERFKDSFPEKYKRLLILKQSPQISMLAWRGSLLLD